MDRILAEMSSSASDVVCKICQRQLAKYTCPTCNVPYCSLLCFRSTAHGECSEGFYRKEIATDGATAKTEERFKMMEMLKRLEEAPEDEDDSEDEDEEDGGRFADIDLDDPDALWERLSPEERAQFLASPFSALVVKPWWEDTDSDAQRPPPLDIPSSLTPNPTPGIIHNLLAIVVSYAYACRHLAIPSVAENEEARALLSTLIPFLVDPHSNFVFASIDDVITSLTSKEVPAVSLLGDGVTLLRPRVITEAGLHPHDLALRVLADIHYAFDAKPKVQRKLVWYAACVGACVGRQGLLGRIVDQVVERQRAELKDAEDLQHATSKLSITHISTS